jgi:hypothetical protein
VTGLLYSALNENQVYSGSTLELSQKPIDSDAFPLSRLLPRHENGLLKGQIFHPYHSPLVAVAAQENQRSIPIRYVEQPWNHTTY